MSIIGGFMEAFANSDIGKVRDMNQDSYYISDKDDNAGNKKEEDENKDYITKLEVNDNTVVDLFNKMNNVACHYCGVPEYYTNSKVTVASLGNEFVY